VLKRSGEVVAAQEPVMVIESMKMEFPLLAPCAARVLGVLCLEGSSVTAGQDVMVLEPL
jgi:urea carboxylase